MRCGPGKGQAGTTTCVVDGNCIPISLDPARGMVRPRRAVGTNGRTNGQGARPWPFHLLPG